MSRRLYRSATHWSLAKWRLVEQWWLEQWWWKFAQWPVSSGFTWVGSQQDSQCKDRVPCTAPRWQHQNWQASVGLQISRSLSWGACASYKRGSQKWNAKATSSDLWFRPGDDIFRHEGLTWIKKPPHQNKNCRRCKSPSVCPQRASWDTRGSPRSTLLHQCGSDSLTWMHIEIEIWKSERDRESAKQPGRFQHVYRGKRAVKSDPTLGGWKPSPSWWLFFFFLFFITLSHPV